MFTSFACAGMSHGQIFEQEDIDFTPVIVEVFSETEEEFDVDDFTFEGDFIDLDADPSIEMADSFNNGSITLIQMQDELQQQITLLLCRIGEVNKQYAWRGHDPIDFAIWLSRHGCDVRTRLNLSHYVGATSVRFGDHTKVDSHDIAEILATTGLPGAARIFMSFEDYLGNPYRYNAQVNKQGNVTALEINDVTIFREGEALLPGLPMLDPKQFSDTKLYHFWVSSQVFSDKEKEFRQIGNAYAYFAEFDPSQGVLPLEMRLSYLYGSLEYAGPRSDEFTDQYGMVDSKGRWIGYYSERNGNFNYYVSGEHQGDVVFTIVDPDGNPVGSGMFNPRSGDRHVVAEQSLLLQYDLPGNITYISPRRVGFVEYNVFADGQSANPEDGRELTSSHTFLIENSGNSFEIELENVRYMKVTEIHWGNEEILPESVTLYDIREERHNFEFDDPTRFHIITIFPEDDDEEMELEFEMEGGKG